MGITNFHKYIKNKYGKAFKTEWLKSYDNVYVDINYALHFCSYGAKSEAEVLQRLLKFFENIFAELVPTRSINVCSDGVAPLSKLILQRKRRLTMSRGLGKDLDENTFSSLMFTPGTKFMRELRKNLENYFEFVEYSLCIKVNYLPDDIDEAELKLKYKVMKNIKKHPEDSHIIVTNDADVIVMLQTLENVENTFIFCKNKHQNEILSIGKLLDLHTDEVGMTKNAGLDFSLISIMMGNDYLPKVNFISFETAWRAYTRVARLHSAGLVIDRNLSLNPVFFKKFMYELLRQMKPQYAKKLNKYSAFKPLYDNYFDGLMWCLDTYTSGKCTRYNYMYGYTESPHPFGLIIHASKNPELLSVNRDKFPPIDITLYSILVLPKSAKVLINKKYHDFMEETTILYDEENCKTCQEFYKKIKDINTQMEDAESENDEDIKTESKKISKMMSLHKKQHDDLDLNDIEDIIIKFNDLKKT